MVQQRSELRTAWCVPQSSWAEYYRSVKCLSMRELYWLVHAVVMDGTTIEVLLHAEGEEGGGVGEM